MTQEGFAIWITGLPSSGKSTICREITLRLQIESVVAVVLESDRLRRILTPAPTYQDDERNRFYAELAGLGRMLIEQGINVLFDATAHLRRYRDQARALIPRFLEVYVECPLELCMERDPKGIYRSALSGGTTSVPGIQVTFEPPERADITLDCRKNPERNAELILSLLRSRSYI
jgi:adenylylsulfate kinase